MVGMADTEREGEAPVAPRRQGRTGSAGVEERGERESSGGRGQRSRGEGRQEGGEDARDGFSDTWVRENTDRSRQRAARVSQVETTGTRVRDIFPCLSLDESNFLSSVWSWPKVWGGD